MTGTETAGEANRCDACMKSATACARQGRPCCTLCSQTAFGSHHVTEPAAPTEARGLGERVAALAEVIWHASRADESTISATGADIVARAVLDAGYVPGDSLMCCPECGSVFEAEDNTVVCDHAPELSAKRLAGAAAPETEGQRCDGTPQGCPIKPCNSPVPCGGCCWCLGGCGMETQPAAEGVREDAGLATWVRFIPANELIEGFEAGDFCICGSAHGTRGNDDNRVLEAGCIHYTDALKHWLAEDRRRARAEGGAEALEEAAEEFEERITHVPDARVDSGGFETGMDVGLEIAYTETTKRLRDRAAGLRETGGKGQTPRQALLAAAARLTDMGISARAAELLTEWAHE